MRATRATNEFAIAIADALQREAAFALRLRVFCGEQGVPQDAELDEFEHEATHVVAMDGERVVGTLRWRPICGGARVKIERVAVSAELRGRGIGAALMRFALAKLDAQHLRDTILHAQMHAQAFYHRLGYVEEGLPFEEDGILHIKMRRTPPTIAAP